MLLHKSQEIIAQDNHRFRVLCCGRRFGKTVLAVEEMVGLAISSKERRIAYFAPTRDDARDITWALLVKKCENITSYKNESRLELKVRTIDKGESLITLYGWESVQERGKGRGLANDFIVCDEVSSYRNFWEGWNEVLSPTLIDKKGSAMFISTPKGFNHFHDLYNLQEKDPYYKSFHFTSYDNPFIPKEEIDRERLSKPEDTFAQEYLADFRKTQGLVYKDFNRLKHVYTESDFHAVDRLVGIDWGYTNPAAIYLVEKDSDNHFWITQEYYKTQKTTSELIEYSKSLRGNKYYPDPAEPDRIEEARRAGLNIREVSKDIEAGISAVQELLKTGRLHIHSSCVSLINEFETYRYPDKKPEQNEKETPVKENDHALDCIRYVLYMQSPAGTTLRAHQYTPNHIGGARRGYYDPTK